MAHSVLLPFMASAVPSTTDRRIIYTYRTNFRWLSICHKLLGAGTRYDRLATVWLHQLAAASRLVALRADLTRALCTRKPFNLRYPDNICTAQLHYVQQWNKSVQCTVVHNEW